MSWLEQIRGGDRVVVDSGRQGQRLHKVKRTTATFIIVEIGQGGTRYRRKDGKVSGGASTWHIEYLVEATPELVRQLTVERLRRAAYRVLERTKWRDMGDDDLQKVVEIVTGITSGDQHG